MKITPVIEEANKPTKIDATVMTGITTAITYPWTGQISSVTQTFIYSSLILVIGMFVGRTVDRLMVEKDVSLLGFGA